jgi:3-dehydroquinate synthase
MAGMHCTLIRDYDVIVTSKVFDPANSALSAALDCQRGIIVVDEAVMRMYGTSIRAYMEERLPGFISLVAHFSEQGKTLDTVLDICAAAQRHHIARRDVLVAVGGGVCCDLVSVAASLIRRGVPYITVPTTLLGQIDAGIALKGAVNFGGQKNYLGCFRAPSSVLIDPDFLQSVSRAELRSGTAEMMKIALVKDRALWFAIREHGPTLIQSGFRSPKRIGSELIDRSVELMLEELAANPYEEFGLRRLADFGHTFSTRLEELSCWRLRHGEAVAVDMALSSVLAAELGLLGEQDLWEILCLITALGLPIWSPLLTENAAREAVVAAVRHRGGALNLVVPRGIGVATFVERPGDLPGDVLGAALRRVQQYSADLRLTPA